MTGRHVFQILLVLFVIGIGVAAFHPSIDMEKIITIPETNTPEINKCHVSFLRMSEESVIIDSWPIDCHYPPSFSEIDAFAEKVKNGDKKVHIIVLGFTPVRQQ